jgi:putative SOS response-associated peptidase YedK
VSGEVAETSTIMTMTCNKVMEPLHNRMPVILDDSVEDSV